MCPPKVEFTLKTLPEGSYAATSFTFWGSTRSTGEKEIRLTLKTEKKAVYPSKLVKSEDCEGNVCAREHLASDLQIVFCPN